MAEGLTESWPGMDYKPVNCNRPWKRLHPAQQVGSYSVYALRPNSPETHPDSPPVGQFIGWNENYVGRSTLFC